MKLPPIGSNVDNALMRSSIFPNPNSATKHFSALDLPRRKIDPTIALRSDSATESKTIPARTPVQNAANSAPPPAASPE